MKKIPFFGFLTLCCVLAGCGVIAENTQKIGIDNLEISYDGSIIFQPSNIAKDDKVLAIYEEEGDEDIFKDSLIFAKQYDLGKGTLTFARDSIQLLKDKGLKLENENEWKTILNDHGKKRTLVIMSYVITEGFLSKVPKLYMTQVFLESDNEIYVLSHSTEEKSEQKNIINAFKKLSYIQ